MTDGITPFGVHRPEMLLFGDSLTDRGYLPGQGWALPLTGAYRRRVDIVHRGYGGYSTHDALQILPAILAPYKKGPANTPAKTSGIESTRHLAFALVWFGANDAAKPAELGGTPTGAKQHVPLDNYGDNLKEIARQLREVGAKVVFLTPPPVLDDQRKQFMVEQSGQAILLLDRENEYTKKYAEKTVLVGKELGVPVLDLWTRLQQEPDWNSGRYLDDGLHFTPAGQALIAPIIADFVANQGEFPVEATPNQFPPWGDVVGTGEWGKRIGL